MEDYLYMFLGLSMAYAIYLYLRPSLPDVIFSRWSHYIVDYQFSAEEFYKTVEAIIHERKLPDVYCESVYIKERLFFSDYRIYHRVHYETYLFDVCAAPYGTGFFISWWFGERVGWLRKILFATPLIGSYFLKQYQHKTYYILDKEDMFQRATHQAVLDAMNMMTSDKGIRGLTELEKQPKSFRSTGL